MSKNSNYLTASIALCNNCNKSLPITGDYVKCYQCGCKYHYSPCATLSESTYSKMNADKKAAWKCHGCKGRKSPNNLYQTVNHEDQQQHQTQLQQDQQEDLNDQHLKDDGTKRSKESISIDIFNTNVEDLKSDICTFKTTVANDMSDIKAGIEQLTCSLNSTHNALREDMASAFAKLTNAMTGLANQVNDLKEQNKEKDLRLHNMEKRVNELEQKMLNRNVEIKNVKNEKLTPAEVIKTIGASVNVQVLDTDISNAYKIKKQNKIIVEFCSLNKKREIMSNISRHRVKGSIFKPDSATNSQDIENNDVFINDELSAHNRKLLWLAKVKAKESGWMFVWFNNGHVLAKKSENSNTVLILSSNDIDLIA